MRHKGLICVLALTTAMVWGSAASAQQGQLDLTYLGAFRAVSGTPQILLGGMAFYPAGDGGNGSLFLSDAPGTPAVYELTIPNLVISSTAGDLNTATVLGSFNLSDTAHGLAYRATDDKLYYSTYPGVSTQYFRSVNRDGTGESSRRTLGWSYVGRGLFTIPGGWGPSPTVDLAAVGEVRGIRIATVDAWNATPTKTDLVFYDTTAHQMPGYEYPDSYTAAEWIEAGTTANIVVAGEDVNRAKPMLFFYKADDIAAATSAWQPVPYKAIELGDWFLTPAVTLDGMAFDAANAILYGYESRWDNPAVIHAWHVTEAQDNPPTTITDLTVSTYDAFTATLTWTAPTDDFGTNNAAATYDIRYALTPIDEANWASATACTNPPTPSVPGTPESYCVTALTPETTYYLAVRAGDGSGQLSDLSNVVSITTQPEDITPPAAVIDLQVGDIDSRAVHLTWTASGDDGSTGTAASYDIRVSTSPITDDTTFAAATPIDQSLTPQPAGQTETLLVTDLTPSTAYSFAMKVLDDAGNVSVLSNGASATTLAPDTTPPAAVADLQATGAGCITIDLSWTASGDDGMTGTAAAYDIRVSTDPIDATTWASATVIPNDLTPAPAGTAEEFTILGNLHPGTVYYVAIRALDEEANAADLSNVVTQATVAAPPVPVVTSIEVIEKAGVATSGYPMTIGIPFVKGDVADGVTARVDGLLLATQTDVKVRHTDNSVKHALVSFVIPQIPATGQVTVDLLAGVVWTDPSYVTAQQLLDDDFDASMAITVDAVPTTVTATGLLQRIGSPNYWIQGPICSELIFRDNSLNVAEQLNVQWRVRRYPGWDGMRIETVVENCWTEYRGNIDYDFTLAIGGTSPTVVRQTEDFHHNANARWHLTHWLGNEPPEVEVHYDIDYLIASGLVPTYDTSLVVPESTMAAAYTTWQNSGHDIMDSGIIETYFGTTGGRQDLGILPTWTARYLLTFDNRMRAIMLNCGDLSGSVPIHYRESDPNRSFVNHVMSIDDRPTIWAGWWDFSGTSAADAVPPALNSETTVWSPDSAHQPSLACIPYLVTGDLYYLEEFYFWAGRNLTYNNWVYRGGDGSLGLCYTQDTRAQAWSIRTIANAANLAPDGDLEKEYFTNKINNNIADMVNRYLVNGDFPAIRYIKPQDASYRPDTLLETECTYYTSAWQDDFMMIVLGHMRRIGFDTGSLIQWLGRSIVDRLTHPDYNPYRSAPYHIPTHGSGGQPYATWLEVNNAFVDDVGPTDFPNPDDPGSYRYVMRSACSQIVHVPGGMTAWQWLESHVYSEVLLNEDPTWSLIPTLATDLPLADLNIDGRVDLDDCSILIGALGGPGILPGVYSADLDADGDCDLHDVAQFVQAFEAP